MIIYGYTPSLIVKSMRENDCLPTRLTTFEEPNRYCLMGYLARVAGMSNEEITEKTLPQICPLLNLTYDQSLQLAFGWDDGMSRAYSKELEPKDQTLLPYYFFGRTAGTLALAEFGE